MIGLEFIIQVYGKKSSEVAAEISVSRQTLNDWIKGRKKIPALRLQSLKKLFPSIPHDYFQKTLTKLERINIQEIYFRATDVFEEIAVSFTDNDGNERIGWQIISENEPIIRILQDEYQKEELIERYVRLIDEDGESEFRNKKMLEKYIDLLEQNDEGNIRLLRMVFYFLRNESQWGYDPFFAEPQKQKEMYDEFECFLKKHGF